MHPFHWTVREEKGAKKREEATSHEDPSFTFGKSICLQYIFSCAAGASKRRIDANDATGADTCEKYSCKKPLITNLALYRSMLPCISYLIMKHHLLSNNFLSSGISTAVETFISLKTFNSVSITCLHPFFPHLSCFLSE